MRLAPASTLLIHIVAVVTILGYLSPHLIRGESSHVMIFDQLDITFVDLKVLAESGRIFALPNAIIPNQGGGMPRATFPSGFYVPVWLMYFFSPFAAFVINQVFIRVVAYFGLYLLLTRHLQNSEHSRIAAAVAAIAFAVLPYYSLFGLSIAGQPLFLHAFLNVRSGRRRWLDWLILWLMPVYLTLPLGGFFIICVAVGIWLYDLVKRSPTYRATGKAIAGILVSCAIVEHQLLLSLLSTSFGFVSQRVEFAYPTRDIAHAVANFVYGHEHAATLQSEYVLPALGLAILTIHWYDAYSAYCANTRGWQVLLAGSVLFAAWFAFCLYMFRDFAKFTLFPIPAVTRLFEQLRPHLGAFVLVTLGLWGMLAALSFKLAPALRHSYRLLLFVALANGAISVWYWLWWDVWGPLKQLYAQLPYIDLSRFYYLQPLLWYIIFGLALSVLWVRAAYAGKLVVLIAGTLQIFFLFGSSHEREERRANRPTYAEFFSEPLFDDIARFIGRAKSEYRVASVGMHPSIAAFNGFYTVDGYNQYYPLAYKHRFRKLIDPELQKSEFYRGYFSNSGSRYYMFVSELKPLGIDEFVLTKDVVARHQIRIRDYALDAEVFRSMGGEYVFSAVEIENAAATGLIWLKTFERSESPWRIFLYQAAQGSN